MSYMSKAEKYLWQKEAELPPEIRLHQKRVNRLQELLFKEEWDSLHDSASEAGERASGQNPMDSAYTARINSKRESFGVSPLGENGMPQDESSREFCKKVITELESIKD